MQQARIQYGFKWTVDEKVNFTLDCAALHTYSNTETLDAAWSRKSLNHSQQHFLLCKMGITLWMFWVVKWCSATNGTVEQWNWDRVSGSLKVLEIMLGSNWDQSTNIHGHQCLLSIYSVEKKKRFIFVAHNNPKLGPLTPKTDGITVDWEVKGLVSKAARKCWSKDSNPGNLPSGSEVTASRPHRFRKEAFNMWKDRWVN